jgi:pyruvate dehydrogenase E2 component (dihydrolipoamide acetyltransferase)
VAKAFKLPEVGEGIETGTVVSLLVSEGDSIEVDQPLLELETDKAVVEVPSSVAGVVREIKVKAGDEVKVGAVVLVVDDEAIEAEAPVQEEAEQPEQEVVEREPDEVEIAAKEPDEQEAKPVEQADKVPAASEGRPADEREVDGARIPAAPSVRRLAREKGVDLREVKGSGILGRISAEDVLRFAEGAPAPAAAPQAAAVKLPDFSRWGETERAPMSGIRKATVRSMATAWAAVPMVTHFDKADITEFEALRKRYQSKAEAMGAKLTPTAMLIKIVAGALRKFPDFNASIDVEKSEIIYKRYVNVGVAVDTDYGLLVPVIKHADRKSMLELAKELGELAEKARERKLGPEDMQGGNFSVSNLGGIGGHGFTPIVNPPEVAILGVSRASYEPVYNQASGEFEARLMMPLCVTYDHRLIDGAAAARFLRWVCQAIEEPFLLALEG